MWCRPSLNQSNNNKGKQLLPRRTVSCPHFRASLERYPLFRTMKC